MCTFLMQMISEVCLIEDEHIQNFLNKKFIEKTQVVQEVSEFLNGKEAFDAMEHRVQSGKPLPDVIFLDLNMPVWDGWDFFKAFRDLPGSETTTTYILTSSLSEDDYKMAEQYGLQERYLKKPLAFERLKSVLTAHTKPKDRP